MNPSMKSKVYTALIYHIMSILSFFFNFYFAFYSIFDNILLSWTWENQSIISPLAKKNLQTFFCRKFYYYLDQWKFTSFLVIFCTFFMLRIADNKYKHRFAIRALKSAKRYQNKSEIDVNSADEALLLILKTHLMKFFSVCGGVRREILIWTFLGY